MPNLFSNRRAPVTQALQPMHYDPTTGFTVIDVQETDEGPAPGTSIKPIPDPIDPRNNPYRGHEDHGVSPLYDIPVPEDEWEGGSVVVNTDKLSEEPENVVPVRIVNESARETERWFAARRHLTTQPQLVMGRDTRRTALTLRNVSDDTVTIYIAPNVAAASSIYSAYPIALNDNISISGCGEVWAFTSTDSGTLAVIAEYTAG